jgi:hypothetical protein
MEGGRGRNISLKKKKMGFEHECTFCDASLQALDDVCLCVYVLLLLAMHLSTFR